eukprot:154769_1
MTETDFHALTPERIVCMSWQASYDMIVIFIYIPYCIYAVKQLQKVQHNIIFRKRFCRISITFIIISLISYVFDVAVGLLTYGASVPIIIQLNIFYSIHLWILWLSLLDLLLFIFVWKVFCIFYQTMYSQVILNNEWKSIINPALSDVSLQQNWFIKHKSTFGNLSFWKKYLILTFIITLFIMYAMTIIWCYANTGICIFKPEHKDPYYTTKAQQYGAFLISIAFVIGLIAIALIFVVRCKTPEFEDTFYIRDELKNVILICAITVLIHIVLTLIWFIVKPYVEPMRIVNTMTNSLYGTTVCLLVHVQSIWVIKKNKKGVLLLSKTAGEYKVTSARTAVQLQPLPVFKDNQSNAVVGAYNQSKIKDDHDESVSGNSKDNMMHMTTLLHTLQSEQGFNSYMFHLTHEFSVEVMLSLIEFYQYKKYIHDHEQFQIKEEDRMALNVAVYFAIFDSEYMPTSHIVCMRRNVEGIIELTNDRTEVFDLLLECMMLSYKLYFKYIYTNCSMVINISYELRSKLIDTFGETESDDDDDGDLKQFISKIVNEKLSKCETQIEKDRAIQNEINLFYHIFDDCCEDMLKLMAYSFDRFKQTALFKKLIRCYV